MHLQRWVLDYCVAFTNTNKPIPVTKGLIQGQERTPARDGPIIYQPLHTQYNISFQIYNTRITHSVNQCLK